jgi:DNA-binding NarL/FixJ family response regulator
MHLVPTVRVDAAKVANVKIILANSNPIMRRDIRILVAGTPDLEIVGEAGDGQGILELLQQRTPDLVILDIFLLNIHGLAITKIIKTNYPQIIIIIITRDTNIEFLFHALYNGADGYLLGKDAEATLIAAIEMIKKGKYFISPSIVSLLSQINIKDHIDHRELFSPLFHRLSGREKEVLRLISKGNSNQEIACVLNLSVKTIHNHRARMIKKLHCRHSTDLIRYAIQKLPLFL